MDTVRFTIFNAGAQLDSIKQKLHVELPKILAAYVRENKIKIPNLHSWYQPTEVTSSTFAVAFWVIRRSNKRVALHLNIAVNERTNNDVSASTNVDKNNSTTSNSTSPATPLSSKTQPTSSTVISTTAPTTSGKNSVPPETSAHLKLAGRRKVSSNLIISAIHNYGVKKFRKEFGNVKIKFRGVEEGSRGRNSSHGRPKRMFPSYLSEYFRTLTKKQKCYILRTLSTHTNYKLTDTVRELSNTRYFNADLCSDNSRQYSI